MALKPIAWLGDSRKLVRDFPDKARQRAGYLLYQVQDGMEPEELARDAVRRARGK